MPSLKPISNATLAERVEERLIDFFKESDFKPGDAIPGEVDLATQLEVSRPVIREALSRLRMVGMVESRKRRGMILREPDLLGAIEKVLIPNLLSDHSRKELFELRLVLEVGMSDLLFVRKTKKDLEALDVIIEKEAALFDKDRTTANISSLIRCDIDFHSRLYQIAGNEMLERLQRVLIPTIQHVVQVQFNLNPLAYGKVTHRQLLDILKTGSPDKFRNGMRDHLELHFDTIQ